MPLAIPHGVVKDLSQHEYKVDLFLSGEGFKTGEEYILKLGEGNGNDLDKYYSGFKKNCYGTVDPDNVIGGGAKDYENRLKYGFSGSLQINDRIIPEYGNMVGPTDDGVEFRIESLTPRRRIVVPITDVGEEVAINNPRNADAKTIYDIQGNDQADGVYDSADYDFGSAVRIIGFAEFEILAPEDFTRSGGDLNTGDYGDLGYDRSGQVRGKFISYVVKPGEVALN